MPLQATSGAASYDAFGGGVVAEPNYIESVFSTYLYTGTGTSQTITNGIDLSGKGGLVWIKNRDTAGRSHRLIDTVRGGANYLESNNTNAQGNYSGNITSFNSTGFSIGDASFLNESGGLQASWTFRKQPKFFDVVTYTGTGVARTVAHNLGSVPGCIIVKSTTSVSNWYVYHRSLATNQALKLNSTAAIETFAGLWNNTAATSTEFSVGTAGDTNGNGQTFVAYIFAHDAGGFGLTGTDNVISCGSFTTDGSGNATVNLGYEPQWVLIKPTNEVNSWVIVDTMRGYSLGAGDAGEDARLRPNTSDAESTSSNVGYPTATGFYVAGSGSMQHIYIAIRRGPMKVPTLGTSVYNAVVRTGTRAVANLTGLGFTPDTAFVFDRNAQSADSWFDRLRGVGIRLRPHDTGAEQTFSDTVTAFNMDGISYGADATANSVNYSLTSNAYINWFFKRAPGFFDEVCYTGTGSNTTQTHNLGVVPELMIIKRRSAIGSWCTFFGMGASNYYRPLLNSDVSAPLVTYSDGFGLSAQPTSTVINLDSGGAGNDSGTTYVAYLFATCAGVSKVGTYTGTGTTQTINCGFTGGARFVLIKRTDSTGDWYVWDSARGIVSGNDSYLLLNSTAAEVTSTDYIDTASTGFEISSTAPAAINANGGSFIFLAIA